MKLMKEPKFKPCACKKCGTVFMPEIEKHLFVIAPIKEFDGWARIQLADIMRLKKKYTQTESPEGD